MESTKKIHFIGLGERAVNDLAIEMKKAGHSISCSFGEISEPERDKLLKHNIINEKIAVDKIGAGVDLVVICPQAKKDNPEVRRTQALNIPLFSVADLIFESSKDKQRLVVTGNHGKALITALIIHVLAFHKRKFDYYVSARLHNFVGAVKLSDAPIIVIEGQDVNASDLDTSPTFLKYHHHVGVINGIEWQASGLYPTRDEYVRQFGNFGASTPKGGILVYFELDPVVAALPNMNKPDVLFVPYKTHPSIVENGREFLVTPEKERVSMTISGKHNMQNISAAQETLKRIGVSNEMFYQAMPTFESVAH